MGATLMATIDVMKNGPYVVKDIQTFTNSHQQQLPLKPVMTLCRCGHSSGKPFCDGTHGKIGFSDEKLPGRVPQERREFPGKKITILDNESVCSHAGFCDGGLPDVFWKFEGGKRIPHPDAASQEKIMERIKLCPSGALRYKLKGKMDDQADRQPGLTVSRNGPYYVVGSPELKDEINSRPDSAEHYTLCRCGASKNKPFCDGSHGKVKFKDGNN